MQNQNLPLLLTSRANYKVPKGEEQVVHYKAERVMFDPHDGTTRISHPDLLKTNVRMFDDVKRNLELQGYTVEILYHPEGKYSDVVIPKGAKQQLAEKDAELRAKEDEIARLKAQIEAQNKANASEKEGEKEESAPKIEGENGEAPKPKRGAKTKKSE